LDSTKEKDSSTLNPGAVSGTCGTSYLGFGAVPPTYSNVTITSTGVTTTPIYTTGTGVSNPWASTNSTGKLNLDGDQADIVINGKSLGAAIAKIEQRLNILVPNSELEAEWAELKKLGDAYRKLEQDLIEKADMWGCLKATEPKL
jgi:hypothetical protein